MSKTLKQLLKDIEIIKISGNRELKISSIHCHSGEVKRNSLFVVIKGNNDDGSKYVGDAIKKGAKVIVYDSELNKFLPNINYVKVKDSRIAIAEIASSFYNSPSKKLKLVGVTGTNGKTTTATLLYNLFNSSGGKSALLSTIENKIGSKTYKTKHTTPDPITINMFLDKAVKAKCKYAFMECSSHAIDQKRINGLEFAGAVFTNLTQDHLDYHKTMEEYSLAKRKLFDLLPQKAFAVGNADDPKYKYIFKNTKAKKYSFGLMNKKYEFRGKILSQNLDGSIFNLNGLEIKTKLAGKFNIYNLLGIFSAAKLLGLNQKMIISGIAKLTPPKGRLEFIKSKKGVYGVVDYSHTPDALEKALNTLREVTQGRIITVVGCGGDRDKTKRPIMGNIAVKLSDFVVFTSDNPRNEKPENIIKEIVSDLPKKTTWYKCEVDRKKAIDLACNNAKPGDIVLVAGKGHENYQIFKDRTIDFSDIDELQKNLI